MRGLRWCWRVSGDVSCPRRGEGDHPKPQAKGGGGVEPDRQLSILNLQTALDPARTSNPTACISQAR